MKTTSTRKPKTTTKTRKATQSEKAELVIQSAETLYMIDRLEWIISKLEFGYITSDDVINDSGVDPEFDDTDGVKEELEGWLCELRRNMVFCKVCGMTCPSGKCIITTIRERAKPFGLTT